MALFVNDWCPLVFVYFVYFFRKLIVLYYLI